MASACHSHAAMPNSAHTTCLPPIHIFSISGKTKADACALNTSTAGREGCGVGSLPPQPQEVVACEGPRARPQPLRAQATKCRQGVNCQWPDVPNPLLQARRRARWASAPMPPGSCVPRPCLPGPARPVLSPGCRWRARCILATRAVVATLHLRAGPMKPSASRPCLG